MTVFTHKYSPKHSKQVFGQQKAVEQLKDFIEGYKQQKFKAALCFGPIGCGKTSAIYAIAKELKYDLLEINSSNLRNKDNITSFLSAALGQQSLFFTPKIILIDEIDNISGVKDRGCIPALLKAIQKASFPVILTANDPSDKKFKSLRKVALPIEFHKLQYRTIAHGLEWVAQQENIEYEEKAILSLARQVDGDMRAALLDLQVCSADGKFTFDDVINFIDFTRLSGSKPERILPPASRYSGRSVLSLIVTHGTPKNNASSGTVPESVIKHKAFFSSLVKSKNPRGFIISIHLGTDKFFNLLEVLGCMG